MATVWIPPLLRDLTLGQEKLTVNGSTIRQLITELDRTFPGFAKRICDGENLRPGIAIVVDREVVRRSLDQNVGASTEVHFIPGISGGQWPAMAGRTP